MSQPDSLIFGLSIFVPSQGLLFFWKDTIFLFYIQWLIFYLFRLLADFLGFAGAIGIQIIVSSLQDDISDVASDQMICSRSNMTSTDHDKVNESDTMTISQFLHNRLVAAVIILLASLFQGAFSQVIAIVDYQLLLIHYLLHFSGEVMHYEYCYIKNFKQKYKFITAEVYVNTIF